jgi:hypothetical protein
VATQIISVVKVAGPAGDFVWQRLRGWAAKRQGEPGGESSNRQWPPEVPQEADRLADLLRSHSGTPPVIHFVEWVDTWTMGDTIARWLIPVRGTDALRVYGERYELFGYFLPDEGVLARHLADAGSQQHPEAEWLVTRLQEALVSWDNLIDRAVLLVLRQVMGPTVTDEELLASLQAVPIWLAG